jgi:hypothetical protein
MLAVRITFAHFSMSCLISVPYWSLVLGKGSMLCAADWLFSSGSARTRMVSLFSRSMTACGVPAGALRPTQRFSVK